MLWFLTWTVLVLLGVAVLAALGWSVFRKGIALAREMGAAAELLGQAAEQAERLGNDPPDPGPAVFVDPHELRRERDRARRRGRRAKGRSRV